MDKKILLEAIEDHFKKRIKFSDSSRSMLKRLLELREEHGDKALDLLKKEFVVGDASEKVLEESLDFVNNF